jgi:hypothetical protein
VFRRISFDDYTDVFAIAALFISLTVFVFFLVRVFRMKRKHEQHMSQLPLHQDSTNSRKP